MLRIRIHSEKETGSVSSDRYLILRESEFCGILQCISCQICLQKPVLPVKKSISGPLRNLPRGYGRMPVQRGHPVRDGVFHGVSWKDKVQSCGGTQQTYPKSCDKEKGEERMSQKYDKKAIQTVFVLFCFPFFTSWFSFCSFNDYNIWSGLYVKSNFVDSRNEMGYTEINSRERVIFMKKAAYLKPEKAGRANKP